MNLGMILIVSDDAAFARQVSASWEGDAEKPALTLMSGDVCRHPADGSFYSGHDVEVSASHRIPNWPVKVCW